MSTVGLVMVAFVALWPIQPIDKSLQPSETRFAGVTVPMMVYAIDLYQNSAKYDSKLVSVEGFLTLENDGAYLQVDSSVLFGGPLYIDGVNMPPRRFFPMNGKNVRIEGFFHFSRERPLHSIIKDVRWIEEIPPLVTP